MARRVTSRLRNTNTPRRSCSTSSHAGYRPRPSLADRSTLGFARIRCCASSMRLSTLSPDLQVGCRPARPCLGKSQALLRDAPEPQFLMELGRENGELMRRRIEEYALLSDLQSAALVHCRGSIDWCCFPRFDSDACFAALLGHPEHGRWIVAPTASGASTRHYRDGSLVLETEWDSDEGRIRVIDVMPPRGAAP